VRSPTRVIRPVFCPIRTLVRTCELLSRVRTALHCNQNCVCPRWFLPCHLKEPSRLRCTAHFVGCCSCSTRHNECKTFSFPFGSCLNPEITRIALQLPYVPYDARGAVHETKEVVPMVLEPMKKLPNSLKWETLNRSQFVEDEVRSTSASGCLYGVSLGVAWRFKPHAVCLCACVYVLLLFAFRLPLCTAVGVV
jgi:hypothetical protein